jgi:hypothetical protein
LITFNVLYQLYLHSQDLRRAGFSTSVQCLDMPQVLSAVARIYNPLWPGNHNPHQHFAPYLKVGLPVATTLATLAWGPDAMMAQFLVAHLENLAHVPANAPVFVEDLARFDTYMLSVSTSWRSLAYRSNVSILLLEKQVLRPAGIELLKPIYGGSWPDGYIVDRNPGRGGSIQLRGVEFKHFKPGNAGETRIEHLDGKPYHSGDFDKGGVAILGTIMHYNGSHIPRPFTPQQFSPNIVQWATLPVVGGLPLPHSMCILSTETLTNMGAIALHPHGGRKFYQVAGGAISLWRAPTNLFNGPHRLTLGQQFDQATQGTLFRRHIGMDRQWMNPAHYNNPLLPGPNDWVYARHAVSAVPAPAVRVNNISLLSAVASRTDHWPAVGKLQLPMTLAQANLFANDFFNVWDI